MIVRERANEYVMIEQHCHAQISGDIMSQWKECLFIGDSFRNSVELAVYFHDYGWSEFDKRPLWNDREKAPCTFANFPINRKITLYQQGIEAVEKMDLYAALLCSEHYKRFLLNDMSKDAQKFVAKELSRQNRIINSMNEFDQQLFNFHYHFLQFGDNLSLFLCLNEPGSKNHPFFKKGIPLGSSLVGFKDAFLDIQWKGDNTIMLKNFPFARPLDISYWQKAVKKETIEKDGLIPAYESTPAEEIAIEILPIN
ncbi:DUF3891 family protein [Gracilibacillus xinjiangensis]|uniref:DUF3891 family protein n=1 Tax=Gracilibacillus xinjiangensis TaxID=1193282 RepID=A0ABV8WW78_9BACI